MNLQTQHFFLPSTTGQLQCALDLPEADIRGLVLVAHPHPLYGGSMDNKVVHTLVRSFTALNYVAVRMNFRGVGSSEGVHDHGIGETDDMALLLQHMQTLYPDLPFAFAGFSFGTFVMAQLQQRLLAAQTLAAERLVLIGTAAGKWAMPPVPANSILIHGELDETIPLADVFVWARELDLPVMVITGADHFFHRKLQHIKQFIVQLWHR
jgi:alpha/beta superfamily hydrolase